MLCAARGGRRVLRLAGTVTVLLLMPVAAATQVGPGGTPVPARAPVIRDPAPLLPLVGDGTTLDLRWTTTFEAPVAAPAAFDAATAVVPLRNGQLVAVGLDDGRPRWDTAVSTRHQPAIGDGRAYVTRGADVVALDMASGRRVWVTTVGTDLAAPPYWDTGWVIVSAGDGSLTGLRASDGVIVWRQALGAVLACPPTPVRDRLLVGLADGRVASLHLATGAVDWMRTLDAPATGLVALEDQLVAGLSSKAVVSLDVAHGRLRWRWRLGAGVAGAPVADDYRIYVASRDHLLRALDRRTGNLRWMTPLSVRPSGRGPVLIGRNLFVPSFSTSFQAYLAETGKPAFALTLPGEATGGAELRAGGPLLGARVVTLTLEGQLAAFGPRIEPPPVPLAALPGTTVQEPPPVRPVGRALVPPR